MNKEVLLNELYFGSVDSESEENLDKIYIQTQNFDEFIDPNTALLLGSKGAGKSAMYRLFTNFESTAREMAKHAVDNVYFVSGIGFKDIPEMDDMQLLNNIESGIISSEAAWKIYITYKLVHGLYDHCRVCCGDKCKRVLQKSHKIPDYRLMELLYNAYEKIVGEVPKINQIDFKDVSITLGKNSKVSIYDLLSEVDLYLGKQNKTVWILLDKIDELFASKPQTRKECIEGLFAAYIDLVARYKNIKFKIFLRTDIWKTLSFVNKSHLTDKTTIITWNSRTLKELLIKRAAFSKVIHEYINNIVGPSWEEKIDDCYDLIFPEKVYSGSREAKTMSWLIDRSTDGLGGVYPREIINFGNYAVANELKKIETLQEELEPGTSILAGTSIRDAYAFVSQVKVDSYLSEFLSLSEHFKRFAGQTTAEYTQEELIKLMDGLVPSGSEMIRQLHETGVIQYSTGNVLSSISMIIVPRLFRNGLGIITMGRP